MPRTAAAHTRGQEKQWRCWAVVVLQRSSSVISSPAADAERPAEDDDGASRWNSTRDNELRPGAWRTQVWALENRPAPLMLSERAVRHAKDETAKQLLKLVEEGTEA
jgi:hypothetical protein